MHPSFAYTLTCTYVHTCVQKFSAGTNKSCCEHPSLQIFVVLLPKNTGMREESAPAYPWTISYVSPQLMAPYLRIRASMRSAP